MSDRPGRISTHDNGVKAEHQGSVALKPVEPLRLSDGRGIEEVFLRISCRLPCEYAIISITLYFIELMGNSGGYFLRTSAVVSLYLPQYLQWYLPNYI